jgi:hypothetical protein
LGAAWLAGWFGGGTDYRQHPDAEAIEQAFTSHFNELETFSPLSFEGVGPVTVVGAQVHSVAERPGLQWDVVVDLVVKQEGSDEVLPPTRVAARLGKTREGYKLLDYKPVRDETDEATQPE